MAEGIEIQIEELAGTLGQRTLALWACDCAERILYLYEGVHPRDLRPRRAIDAGRDWVQGKMAVSQVRTRAFAAHAAARGAQDPAAGAAARSAGHAAATAHVAGHALHAASYAARAVAVAAEEKDAAATALAERAWQYRHLLAL